MNVKKVVFVDGELEDLFNRLEESNPIKKSLKRAIANIYENPFCGRNVKKKLIPKKYDTDNLWIYNLPNAWRMIYSIAPENKINIIAVILDWMSHKDYEKLFNF